jgi:hypothetical protein
MEPEVSDGIKIQARQAIRRLRKQLATLLGGTAFSKKRDSSDL